MIIKTPSEFFLRKKNLHVALNKYFLFILTFLKCYNNGHGLFTCTSGNDHVCSDGKCYSQSGCPTGTFLISNNTCTCGSKCSGTNTSLLQVVIFGFYGFNLN